MARLLRQLRFNWDDFSLSPQIGSTIAFPGVSLRFNNHFEFLRSEVERNFPAESGNFQKLADTVVDQGETIRDLRAELGAPAPIAHGRHLRVIEGGRQ